MTFTSQLLTASIFFFMVSGIASAQSMRGMPSLPRSGGMKGLTGSAGIGFTDILTQSPSADLKFDRGTYFVTQVERSFDFAHLYLTVGIDFMDAEGLANYRYTNLSSSTTYTLTDVPFRTKIYELTLGLKLKLIDGYWFRPYVEGGGVGNYNELTYGSKITQLSATGSDYKRKDTIMGSGYYAEAGIEIELGERFGLKLAARQSVLQSKKLETLANRTMRLAAETYYLTMLFGF